MPRPFPDPAINDTTSLIKYANTVTGGWMTVLFAIACVVIFFIILKGRGHRTSDSLLVSFMLALVLNSFLWVAGLLAGKILVIFLLLTIASAIYSIFES